METYRSSVVSEELASSTTYLTRVKTKNWLERMTKAIKDWLLV
jgi:hypothetical protein